MNSIEDKMKKILPDVDRDFFGLPSEEYQNIFNNDLENIKKRNAPHEYISFIEKYGVGELSSIFSIDSELKKPEQIYGRKIKDLDGMLIFGSDLGEYVYAFDTKNNWEVVDIDADGEVTERYGDFETFINQILDEIIESDEEE